MSRAVRSRSLTTKGGDAAAGMEERACLSLTANVSSHRNGGIVSSFVADNEPRAPWPNKASVGPFTILTKLGQAVSPR